MKYRKKPVVIDAAQWQGTTQSWDEIMAMGAVPWKPGPMGSKSFIITTLEGDHTVSDGDFVIKGVAGEFYPCKPEIFKQTYEPAEDNDEFRCGCKPSSGTSCSAFVVHCKRAPHDVYIGRPSKWGNPFEIGKDGDRETVIRKYREWLLTQPQLLAALPELKGKVLGCWCAPKACHGDVLFEMANRKQTAE